MLRERSLSYTSYQNPLAAVLWSEGARGLDPSSVTPTLDIFFDKGGWPGLPVAKTS